MQSISRSATFTPKSLVDRHVAEGLGDARKGRTHGPYTSAEAALEALTAHQKKLEKRRT